MFPPELYIHIIEATTSHSCDQAYGLPPESSKVLRELSLVHTNFRSWVTPILYRNVHLTPHNAKKFLKSLQLKQQLEQQPPRVLSLALTKFQGTKTRISKTLRTVCKILSFLSGSLERLLLDMELRKIYQSRIARTLREALDGLVRVQELISVRDELYLSGWLGGPVSWPSWPNIKRIALYNVDPDREFVRAVWGKNLDCLCLLNVRDIVLKDSQLGELFKRPRQPPSVLLIDVENLDDDEYIPFPRWARKEGWLLDERVTVLNILCAEGLTPQRWYLRVALSGGLWSLGRELSR